MLALRLFLVEVVERLLLLCHLPLEAADGSLLLRRLLVEAVNGLLLLRLLPCEALDGLLHLPVVDLEEQLRLPQSIRGGRSGTLCRHHSSAAGGSNGRLGGSGILFGGCLFNINSSLS